MAAEGTARNRRQIGVADLLRALHALDTGASGLAEKIGQCLGFTGLDPNPEETQHGAWDDSASPQRARSGERSPPAPEEPELPIVAPPESPGLPKQRFSAGLEPLDPLPQVSVPNWLTQPRDTEPPAPPLPLKTLLPTNTARPVLSAALGTLVDGEDPDLPRLIERLIRYQSVQRLPMLPRATLERGVDVLLDNAEGMTPFFADLRALASQVRSVVGQDRYRGYSFRGDPRQAAGRRPGRPRSPWQASPGRPVLVVTDFGLGAPPGSRESVPTAVWRELAERCRQTGTPLVGLVPRQPSRWPIGLGRWFKLIHWDPRTRAAAVRHLIGPGHAVEP